MPTSSIHNLITSYYDTKPNFADYIPTEPSNLETDVQKLELNKEPKAQLLILYLGSRDILHQRKKSEVKNI